MNGAMGSSASARRAAWLATLALAACGGRAVTISPPAEAGSPSPVASWNYPNIDQNGAILHDQCSATVLPLGPDGTPDCVFVQARYPHGTASASDVAACKACSAPGLSPLPDAIAPSSINPTAPGYDCLCAVGELPPGSACPPVGGFTASSPAAWCFTSEEAQCPAGMTDAIEYSPAASENVVLFGACFAPGALPVTHQGG